MTSYHSAEENLAVLQRIRQLILPYLEAEGFEIFDLILRREGKQMILKLLIDRPEGGIRLDECAVLNERLSQMLDSEDIIKDRYILEVSSPGIARSLNTIKDFARVIGRKVKFILKEPIEGRREIIAEVFGVEVEFVNVILDNIKIAIPLGKIAKAKEAVEL